MAGNEQVMKLRFLVLMPLLALCTGAFADDFEEGRAAYDQGDYATTILRYEKAADYGHEGAQYNLAVMYHEGDGVPRDHAQAVFWYTKAAQQGNALSQVWLGIMHREGLGTPRDYGESRYWFTRAANQGNSDAQFALGQIHFYGTGYPKNNIKAYLWFYLAGSQGDRDAGAMIPTLEQHLTPGQVAEAKRLVREWESRWRTGDLQN